MIKLSNYDGRFVVRLLELRRAAILEMMQQLPEQSGQERAAELKCLDAVLTQIKAELPQITDPEIAEAVQLERSLEDEPPANLKIDAPKLATSRRIRDTCP